MTLQLFTQIFFATLTLAHEGHNHDAPSLIQAPKGGQVKSVEKTHIEVVSKGNDVKIYLYDKSLKPKSTQGVVLTTATKTPREKKESVMALVDKNSHFEGTYTGPKVHRYNLILTFKDEGNSHSDTLNFTIEPRIR